MTVEQNRLVVAAAAAAACATTTRGRLELHILPIAARLAVVDFRVNVNKLRCCCSQVIQSYVLL